MLTWLRNRLWPALKTSVVRWNRDDGAMLSAAMAYYAAFSLFPLCLVLIAAIGLLTKWTGQAQLYERDMFKFLEQNVGPHLIEQFKAFLAVIQQQAKVGGTIGVLALAVAAIGIFLQLEAMFNRIWQTPPRPYRGWLVAVWWVVWGRCVAFAMLLLAGVLLVALFAANMYLFRIPTQVQSLPLGVWAWRAPADAIPHRRQRRPAGRHLQDHPQGPRALDGGVRRRHPCGRHLADRPVFPRLVRHWREV